MRDDSTASELAGVRTRADAVAFVRALMDRQLQRAAEGAPPPNQSIAGDAEAKRAFWLLLDKNTQRTVFLALCKKREFWPRVRTCIGSPPFTFLEQYDNDMLRAGGITAGRVNMTADTSISSATEMAAGWHFEDMHNRTFKVIGDDNAKSEETPMWRARGARRVVFDVRLPKMALAERGEIFKRSKGTAGSVTYPRVGERLKLLSNPLLGSDSLHVSVHTIESKRYVSPVVRVYCTTSVV